MTINGKKVDFSDCLVDSGARYEDFVWIAYDDSRARLPVAIASSAKKLAEMIGVAEGTVVSTWSKYIHGVLSTAKYARVYTGDVEEEEEDAE